MRTFAFDHDHDHNLDHDYACAVDVVQGATLGNIIANQILRSFLDLHRAKLRGVTNVAQFDSFGSKLPEVIKGVFFILCTKRRFQRARARAHATDEGATDAAARAVRSERGIHGVILLSADGEAITSGNWDDELAIIANVQSLLSASQEISECEQRQKDKKTHTHVNVHIHSAAVQ